LAIPASILSNSRPTAAGVVRVGFVAVGVAVAVVVASALMGTAAAAVARTVRREIPELCDTAVSSVEGNWNH
jgi:hypothetical protein